MPESHGFWTPDPELSGPGATVVGPMCEECGHRRGLHRPAIGERPACSQWAEGQEPVYPPDSDGAPN